MASRFPVYIISGQSNAEGFAPNAQLPSGTSGDAPMPNVYSWWVPSTGLFTWLSADGAVIKNAKSTDSGATFGPEMTFARKMTTTYHPGKQFGLIKYALNASSLYPSLNANFFPSNPALAYQNNWSPTGLRRADWITRILDAQTTASSPGFSMESLGATLDVRGIIWHQGEADAIFGDTATKFDEAIDQYEENCIDLFEFFRTSIVDAGLTTHTGPVPICMALVNHDWYAEVPAPWTNGVFYSALAAGNKYTRLNGIDKVRQAQLNVARRMDRVSYVDTEGLGNNGAGDMIHLNGAGQEAHGEHYADNLYHWLFNRRSRKQYVQGWSTKKRSAQSPMRPIHVMLKTGASVTTLPIFDLTSTISAIGGQLYYPESASTVPVAIDTKHMDDDSEISVTTGTFAGHLTLPAGQWDILWNPVVTNPAGAVNPVRLAITQTEGLVVYRTSPIQAIPATSSRMVTLRTIVHLDEETEIAFRAYEFDASSASLTIAANSPCGHAIKIGNAFEE